MAKLTRVVTTVANYDVMNSFKDVYYKIKNETESEYITLYEPFNEKHRPIFINKKHIISFYVTAHDYNESKYPSLENIYTGVD